MYTTDAATTPMSDISPTACLPSCGTSTPPMAADVLGDVGCAGAMFAASGLESMLCSDGWA